MDKEAINAFLRDLSEVTRKHGLKIDGCGCCNSPRVEKLDEKELAWTDGMYVVEGSDTDGGPIGWVSQKECEIAAGLDAENLRRVRTGERLLTGKALRNEYQRRLSEANAS